MSGQGEMYTRGSPRAMQPDMRQGGGGYSPRMGPMSSSNVAPRMDYRQDHGAGQQGYGWAPPVPAQSMGGGFGGYGPAPPSHSMPQVYRPGGYAPQGDGGYPRGRVPPGYAPQGGAYLPQGGYAHSMRTTPVASPGYAMGPSGPMGGSPMAQGMGGMGGGMGVASLAELNTLMTRLNNMREPAGMYGGGAGGGYLSRPGSPVLGPALMGSGMPPMPAMSGMSGMPGVFNSMGSMPSMPLLSGSTPAMGNPFASVFNTSLVHPMFGTVSVAASTPKASFAIPPSHIPTAARMGFTDDNVSASLSADMFGRGTLTVSGNLIDTSVPKMMEMHLDRGMVMDRPIESHELDLGGAGGLMRVGERGGSVMRVGRHAPPSGLSMHREHLSMRSARDGHWPACHQDLHQPHPYPQVPGVDYQGAGYLQGQGGSGPLSSNSLTANSVLPVGIYGNMVI